MEVVDDGSYSRVQIPRPGDGKPRDVDTLSGVWHEGSLEIGYRAN